MRVIAGQYRGRKLDAPPGLDTRPILDRVKTALFDWLGSRLALPGQLPPLRVLDLFCGSGSLGIEALSRGAASCAFVECHPAALQCLQSNLDLLKIGPSARIYQAPAAYVRFPERDETRFDLIFLDPPYPLSDDIAAGTEMARLLSRIGREIVVSPGALLVWRHDARTKLPESLPNGWSELETRTFGGMTLTFFEFPPELES